MIQLIISDIDGTLIGPDGVLPPENIAALGLAVERGARLAVATIRKRDSAEQIARRLGVGCALVCDGGATIYDERGVRLHSLTIPLDLARALAALADEYGLPLLSTVEELNYYARNSHPAAHIAASGVDVANAVDALDHPPSRFIVRGELGVELLMRAFADAPLRFVRHYHPDGTLADAAITHAGATKESALAILCRQWAIDPADVLALGDSESDIGMLRMAGVGVAVGNAHMAVKAAADWVAPDAADAGVAAAVRRFVLERI
ncbi:MAG TPA: HAD family hydrolase [Roseiflexaceae bacterium]|nr:HAD family hydrolase [Roseiflexaceae bacterium]